MEDGDVRLALFRAAAQPAGAAAAGFSGEAGKPKKKDDKAQKKKGGKGDDAKKKEAASTGAAAPAVSPEELERRFELVKSIGEECVTEDDLRTLLTKQASFRMYDGFEPSGRMHIAQGIFKALNVNKCTTSGGTFVFWIADWFALMNDKMGGDLDKIKVVGEYFIEVWKGAGMDLANVKFHWASDDIIQNAKPYWDQMLDIAKRFTLARIKKCCQIMGRLENNLTAAQIMYPLMQCTDIFFLKADICQLGMDQRKVNMLAREYCDSIGRKLKPVILSHHMLYGLAQGQAKMSKSNPDSAIFMEDPPDEVERKMRIAYCPKEPEEDGVLKNPCLDYVEHIVMSQPGSVFEAGGKTYETFAAVKEAFLGGSLSEDDMKKSIADCVNRLMQPVRDHFETNDHAREILALVRQYKRESAKPPTRLKRNTKVAAPGEISAVFAPLPPLGVPHMSLGDVLGTRASLRAACKDASGGRVVLYVPDLDAVACNTFAGDKKLKATECVAAYYDVFVSALGALGALEGVEVLRQSEVMLMDPSDYWVSVINVGRHFQLQDVLEAINPDETQAGPVLAALMHVGSVLSLAPRVVYESNPQRKSLHELAATYIESCASQADAFAPPQVTAVPEVTSITSALDAANKTQLEVFDDFQPDVKKKLKQAFCEPKNTDWNPPLLLLQDLVLHQGEKVDLVVQSGGSKTFESADDLAASFAAEEIHPADLKAAVTRAAEATYKSLAAGFKSVDKSKKLVQNFIKRASKK
ncbi:Tyrosine--tRNA ligase 2, cytoplasmic [Hondaea fermentalgiana]|uniref:tyrosine--tRNA ligase n=1 Tax=Hondaea fermentalgiana TaxID=2315210 RepID=A0A2R5GKL7_9STRA|nr:Tyrosine--tRNA ligase 2, cytoplasmic [Hondaea fermentalgiana]|eukprot:GBG30859.1 Tyrosine--tRNA ligase 2, cytoplasmic [Hondaea fermentalgiana]